LDKQAIQYKLNGKIITKKALRTFLNENFGLDIFSFSFLMQQNNITSLPTNTELKLAEKVLSAAGTKKYFQVQEDFKKDQEDWKKERVSIVSNISILEQQIEKYHQNTQLFDDKDNISSFLKDSQKNVKKIDQKIFFFELKSFLEEQKIIFSNRRIFNTFRIIKKRKK
jgi:hypothetical protein